MIKYYTSVTFHKTFVPTNCSSHPYFVNLWILIKLRTILGAKKNLRENQNYSWARVNFIGAYFENVYKPNVASTKFYGIFSLLSLDTTSTPDTDLTHDDESLTITIKY